MVEMFINNTVTKSLPPDLKEYKDYKLAKRMNLNED